MNEKWGYLRDIKLPDLSSSFEVGVLIGADMPRL